ncbi:hypothetical protein L8C07_05255 [Paenibacillus sp. CMAA1739]|uniref:hypothetical protein n=1 Tax=Paenibacillus ottowii TaxID=2315729 RepID=UPI002DB7F5A2|nr:hypothetical protein [Paenibacillus sp. CMAA1739]MEC4565344.1 hypothetical protein [Paenibacillus sp. CMAA1739]
MGTGFEEVFENFYSRPQSKVLLEEDLVEQFLFLAVADYELELGPLNYHKDLKQFDSQLNNILINQLGAIMYRHYLSRELDRVLKLTNIVGKDIGLTGMGDTKRTMQIRLTNLDKEIADRFNKLKKNSYYE